MNDRVIVLEINEVPKYIFDKYVKFNPDSTLAKLDREARFVSTIADDVDDGFLYPSQTWASMNSGKPYSEHRVHWYNDSKENCPLFWTDVGKDKKVGVVNSLHSSAFVKRLDRNFEYLIPDCYAEDYSTVPEKYASFQEFVISQMQRSGRVSNLGIGLSEIRGALSLIGVLRPSTYWEILSTLYQMKFKGRRERLRNVEFLVHADLYLKLRKKSDCDLSVFFTNHIASQMHRYLYAAFPERFSPDCYDEEWVNRYSGEIFHSLSLLDKFIAQILEDFDPKAQTLILSTSMGQDGVPDLTADKVKEHTTRYVKDVRRFCDTLFPEGIRYETKTAMVPQTSIIVHKDDVIELNQYLRSINTDKALDFRYEWNENHLTITAHFNTPGPWKLGSRIVTAKELGVAVVQSDSINSGIHIPEGCLYLHGQIPANLPESVSYLEYADLVKGIVRGEMLEPTAINNRSGMSRENGWVGDVASSYTASETV